MIKSSLVILCLIFSVSLFAQKKDSVVYKPDSVDVISVKDLQTVLKYLEDKVTKKQYDEVINYFQLLLQVTDSKRKTTIKHK